MCVGLLPYVAVCVCVCVFTSTVHSGYRLKASPDKDSMKVLYYVEKELAQLPSAKMAALKRKPAQIRPVSVICVCLLACECMCTRMCVCMYHVQAFLFHVHALCKITKAGSHLIPTFIS